MRIVFVTPEVVPYSKTGGLADATAALAAALRRAGAEVTIVTPAYRGSLDGPVTPVRLDKDVTVELAGQRLSAAVWRAQGAEGVPAYLLDLPAFFDRPGLYGDASGDYPDNWLRFGFLCAATFEVVRRYQLHPDILHAHDWQAGLVPLYAFQDYRHYFSTVLTVHNVGHQGLFPPDVLAPLGIEPALFTPAGVEYWGQVGFLKAGLIYADRITTVSPRHAEEICSPDFGRGLEGVFAFRRDALRGILNGVDYAVWDPRHDGLIAQRYGPKPPFAGKGACKSALQAELGLPARPDTPLAGIVTRLTEQKGCDLLLDTLAELARRDLQVAILGAGAPAIEDAFRQAAAALPGRVALRLGYDEGLAHRIQAGADFFLMPSRYEPGGLTQLYALRYGTIPIVHAVGGLHDSVDEGPNGVGFRFAPFERAAWLDAVDRAVAAYRDRLGFTALRERAMERDHSWTRPAASYQQLYAHILEEA